MAKTFNDVITIMKRVIGENDGNDPDATNDILLDYVGNFYRLIMGQEIKSFDLYSYFEFSTVVDQDEYTWKDQGFTNIMNPIYAIDSNNADTIVDFYMNPKLFFDRHPVNNNNENSGRPFSLLLFNDIITIRPKPDQVYTIKARAYKELTAPTAGTATNNIDQEYFLRYIAYGASLDYFADFGNYENYAAIEPIFKRYRNLVMARTAKQNTTQRALPAL